MNIRWQTTPASSKCRQLWAPIPELPQSISLVSFPVHAVSSKNMGPSPWPKNAVPVDVAPVFKSMQS